MEQALRRRELIEELGVTIGQAHAWKVTEHDYPHALVRLHWCKVLQWSGEFEMREGQQMAWQQPAAGGGPCFAWLLPRAAMAERGAWPAVDQGYYEARQPKG